MRSFGKWAVVALLAGASPLAGAVVVNPDPTAFGPDINGTGLFSGGAPIIIQNTNALLDNAASPTRSFGGLGFYFQSDPGTVFTLFGTADFPTAGPPATFPAVVIDRSSGNIRDAASFASRSTFTDVPGDNIGFVQLLDLGTGLSPIEFSQTSLNGGVDLFSAFPDLNVPAQFLGAFEDVNNPGGSFQTFFISAVEPFVTPPPNTPVPVPGTLSLSLLGLGPLVFGVLVRRRRRRA